MAVDTNEFIRLMKAFDKTSLNLVVIEMGEDKITLSKDGQAKDYPPEGREELPQGER